MKCVFCWDESGDQTLTKEHLISQPVVAAFSLSRTDRSLARFDVGSVANADPSGLTWHALDDLCVRLACESCNNGWMNGLEHAMAKIAARFATCFLDDANLYNAMKHGLGVSTGEVSLQLDDMIVGAGDAVEFPESTPWKDDSRTWSLCTQWIDVKESVALIYVACQMIESMWSVGKFRAIGGEPKGKWFLPIGIRPSTFRSANRPPGTRARFGMFDETR
jgi:hypothetical protein